MARFGYSERPAHIEYGVQTWADQLPHRTLIVLGREDQVIPLQTALRLGELIDNADLWVASAPRFRQNGKRPPSSPTPDMSTWSASSAQWSPTCFSTN
jgi:pimeloyl-ACP methyl ester carboxylesterase